MARPEPRSTDPDHYQRLDQPVAAMAKSFPAGFVIPAHSHPRDQLLYAVAGTMRVRTDAEAWLVPPDRAVYVPGGIEHSVAMRGPVEMRTLYIARPSGIGLPTRPMALAVTPLLGALVLALLEESIAYEPATRAGRIAMLILDEIGRAEPMPMSIPMPTDPRLLRVCEALIEDPSLDLTLDDWAAEVGASRRTLDRLFQDECRLSFVAWRQRARFHAAIEALSRGISVGEAARRHGYRSASAFTQAFRKAFGVAPKALASGEAAVV